MEFMTTFRRITLRAYRIPIFGCHNFHIHAFLTLLCTSSSQLLLKVALRVYGPSNTTTSSNWSIGPFLYAFLSIQHQLSTQQATRSRPDEFHSIEGNIGRKNQASSTPSFNGNEFPRLDNWSDRRIHETSQPRWNHPLDYKMEKSKNYWADLDFSGKLVVRAASAEALSFTWLKPSISSRVGSLKAMTGITGII